MTLLDRIRRWSKGEKPPSKSSELTSFTKDDHGACYVCYSLDGKSYATSLTQYLRQRGIVVFSNDAEDIAWGEKWVDTVRNVLPSRVPLILIATPDALRSERVRVDLESFYRRGLILPIMFNSVTKVDDVPYALRGVQWLVEKKLALTLGPSPETVTALLSAMQDFERYASTNRIITPQERDEKRPLNEGKLILVGRGEVGKTSLVRRLVGDNFRGDESKTQGINITSWRLRSPTDTFRLNIWDFGGQEIMHATHQFFLTERSIYLLVLNGREGGEDLDAEYWLKHIESFGRDSPVLVILNKFAQHPFELNYRGLQA